MFVAGSTNMDLGVHHVLLMPHIACHLADLKLPHWLCISPPQGLQRMAAAWQAVPIRQPPTPVRQAAAFALTSSGPPLLYAAGGCHPDLLQVWDLTSEHVMQQVGVVGLFSKLRGISL
jgi:hypothetical protein